MATKGHNVQIPGFGDGSSAKSSQLPAQTKRLIVAVDMGTEWSSVAFADRASPENMYLIRNWPSDTLNQEKVPTQISYSAAGPRIPPRRSSLYAPMRYSFLLKPGENFILNDFDPLDEVKWGHETAVYEDRLRYLKAFLSEPEVLPAFASPVQTAMLLRKYDRNILVAITDYLNLLHRHIVATIKDTYGMTTIDMPIFDSILTVPAMWSQRAKRITLLAAHKAGFGSFKHLQLMIEAEAAATYCFASLPASLRITNANYMVCDAGAGFVEVTTCQISSTQPLTVDQLSPSVGNHCGSADIDRRFQEYIRDRVGPDDWTRMTEIQPESLALLMRYFDQTVKRTFTPADTGNLVLPLLGLNDCESIGLANGFLTVPIEQMRSVFDPTVFETVDFIMAEIEKLQSQDEHIDGLLLVGGYGMSKYLYARLQSRLEANVHEDTASIHGHVSPSLIQLLQPPNGWSATVRGALLRGLYETISGPWTSFLDNAQT